jgi:hypothetical protein
MTRSNAVSRGLLLYIAEHEDNRADVEDWLESKPEIEGKSVTAEEVARAVKHVKAHALIDHMKVDVDLPIWCSLTGAGQQCVLDHAGDIDAWRRAQHGPITATYDQSVRISQGNNAQAVAHAQDVAQDVSLTVDPERLHLAARAAGEVAGLLPDHDRDQVEGASRELAEAAQGGDESAMRRAGARLLAALGSASSLFVVVRFIIDALSGGLGG